MCESGSTPGGDRGLQLFEGVLVVAGAAEVGQLAEQRDQDPVVVGAEVGGAVVDQHDPGGLDVVHIEDDGVDGVPAGLPAVAEPAGALEGVIPGQDVAGGALHDDRPVLAVGFEGVGDRVDVADPRVARVRVDGLDVDGHDAQAGVVQLVGQGRVLEHERGSGQSRKESGAAVPV